MSSTPATSPAGSGCSAGSGSQTTATPVSEKGIPVAAYAYGSGSVGRALGRRSLDTFRSVKESLTSRRALDTTASQTRAAPATACSASAGSSPFEAPAKQRWFASLRSRTSPAHCTPTTPTSLSSTLRRARLFRSSPTQEACDLAAPPSTPTQKLPIRPHLALPRLDMSSFQAEMQRVYTPLGEGFEYTKSSRGPKSEHSSPLTDSSSPEMSKTKDYDSGLPTTVATAGKKRGSTVVASMVWTKTNPTMSSAVVEMKPKSRVSFVNVEPEEALEKDWPTQCALYYKGSPWQPEHSEDFSDAASALSHFALRNMLKGRRRCSNVLLWTSHLLDTNARIKQTFTAYPHCDGPRRIEIEDRYCLEWAFIAFTDDRSGTKLPPMKSKDMSEEDERLMKALKKIVQMGYHVDVWTCRDDENWNFDMDCIRDFGMKKLVAQRYTEPENIGRRERYKAFIQHRVSGFLQADIDLLQKSLEEERGDQKGHRDDEDDDDYDYAYDGYEHEADDALNRHDKVQSRAQVESASDLHGHLDHQDETTAKSEEEDDDEEEASQRTEISVDTEDLDMADRLGV